MINVKIIFSTLSFLLIIIGCGISNEKNKLSTTDIEGTKYSYDLAPGFGAYKAISFQSDGFCESYDDNGSSASYLSSRIMGSWKIKENKIIIKCGDLTGEYLYKEGFLKSSKITLVKNTID
jgi:hypothetical protein